MSNKEKATQRQALIQSLRNRQGKPNEVANEFIWSRIGAYEPEELTKEQKRLFDELKELLQDNQKAKELLCLYDFTMTEKASALMEQSYIQGFKDGLNSNRRTA